jgi:hypothetical protein
MRIGYYVQGTADEAFVHGLAKRWCPEATLAAGKFRGSSQLSFRREIAKALKDLRDANGCDILLVLTDSDVNPWRDVKRREWQKVPEDCKHLCLFGVAERNIECWLATDPHALATKFGHPEGDIPKDDPSGFVKRCFGLGMRGAARDDAKTRVIDFVGAAPLRSWIEKSPSFRDFYDGARALAARIACAMPNERESA